MTSTCRAHTVWRPPLIKSNPAVEAMELLASDLGYLLCDVPVLDVVPRVLRIRVPTPLFYPGAEIRRSDLRPVGP